MLWYDQLPPLSSLLPNFNSFANSVVLGLVCRLSLQGSHLQKVRSNGGFRRKKSSLRQHQLVHEWCVICSCRQKVRRRRSRRRLADPLSTNNIEGAVHETSCRMQFHDPPGVAKSVTRACFLFSNIANRS